MKRIKEGNIMYSDHELLELIKKDKDKGAEELINQYGTYIERVCEKNLHNKEDVKECVNDITLEICMNYEKYDKEKGSLKNYIRIIAQRTAIDRYRKNIRRNKLEEEVLEKYNQNQLNKIQEEKDRQIIEEALEKLPALDRKILSMHYIDSMSYKEISNEIEMSYETVRKRGVRGKKKLLCLILLGLLLFGISASAIITMEKRGALQVIFPFLEDNKSEENLEIEEDINKNELKGVYGPNKSEIEIEIIKEKDQTQSVSKYQYSSNAGIIRTEKAVYEMVKNEHKYQIGDIIYEIKDIIYFNGKWKIDFLVTCMNLDYVIIDGIDENSSIEDFINADNNRLHKWGHDEFDYLEKANLITSDGKNIHLKGEGFETPSIDEPNIIVIHMSCEEYLESEKEEEKNISIILQDGHKYEIVLKKLELKEYIEQNNSKEEEKDTTEENKGDTSTEIPEEENKETDIEEEKHVEIKIGTDIAVVKDGMAVVNLYQKEISEYEITDLITASHFGVPRDNSKNVTIQDEEGNIYQRMRIIKNRDVDEEKINYEIYFQGIEPGSYNLHIPYLCIQKNMNTETIKINLPKELGKMEYDQKILFPDGSGFHITEIILHENIEEVYYWDENETIVEEKIVYYYEIVYEPISIGNIQFNTAKATGISSNGVSVDALAPVIDGRTIYAIRAADEQKIDSVELSFYEPTYYLDQEYTFDVMIQE